MLDIRFIRENPDAVKENIKKKFQDEKLPLVDKVLVQRDKEVQLAVNEFGKGRAVYLSGLPYSFANSRLLHRAVLWSVHSEDQLNLWLSSNYNVDVHAYVKNGKFCVVNNTYEPQSTTVYRGDGSSFPLELAANEIRWYEI